MFLMDIEKHILGGAQLVLKWAISGPNWHNINEKVHFLHPKLKNSQHHGRRYFAGKKLMQPDLMLSAVKMKFFLLILQAIIQHTEFLFLHFLKIHQ